MKCVLVDHTLAKTTEADQRDVPEAIYWLMNEARICWPQRTVDNFAIIYQFEFCDTPFGHVVSARARYDGNDQLYTMVMYAQPN